jgi:hypothetical protein
MSTIMKTLQFAALPTKSISDPVANRRNKIIEKLEEQRKLADDPSYVRKSTHWRGKGPERTMVEQIQKVRSWAKVDATGRMVLGIFGGRVAFRSRWPRAPRGRRPLPRQAGPHHRPDHRGPARGRDGRRHREVDEDDHGGQGPRRQGPHEGEVREGLDPTLRTTEPTRAPPGALFLVPDHPCS